MDRTGHASATQAPRRWARRFALSIAIAGVALGVRASHRRAGAHAIPATARRTERARPLAATGFDMAKIARAAHFAFRVDAASGELEGGDLHYRILVDDNGATLRAFAPGRSTIVSAPITFDTSGIKRTRGAQLAVQRPVPEVHADGIAALRHGAVAETYRNDERGSEQQFELASKPAGDGPLVVRIAVAGMTYRGQTADGLHFIDPSQQLGFRYGLASFVDATGRHSDVAARFAGNEIELEVPPDVVDSAAYPAVLDPVISPEIELDQPVLGNAFAAQLNPAVAFDGTNNVVVWQDPRVGFGGFDVMAARVAPDGTVLDPAGFAIAQTSTDETVPKIACLAQQRCLVTYSDSGGPGSRTVIVDTAMPAALANTNAALLVGGKTPFVLSLAANGTNFVLVYNEVSGTNTNVRATRIDGTTGAVIDASGFNIATSARNESAGGIACAGTNCVVTWTDFDSMASTFAVRFSRFSTATPLTLLDGAGIVVDAAGANSQPQVALSGTTIGIAWTESTMVLAHRYDSNAQPLETNPFTVLTSAFGSFYRVGWSATSASFAVVATCPLSASPGPLNTAGRALAALVDPGTGAVSPAAGVEPPIATALSLSTSFGMTSTATGFTFVFTSNDTQSTGEIVAELFTAGASGPVFAAPVYVSTSSNDERAERVAAAPDVYLVVWTDERRASVLGTGYAGTMWSDVYAARVRASDGLALDPNGIKISTTTGTHGMPDVGFDGTRFLVVYTQSPLSCQTCATNYDVVARRVDPTTGAIVDANPIGIGLSNFADFDPTVCGAAGRFFIAWAVAGHIYSSVMTGATGALVTSSVAVSPATSTQFNPRAVCGTDQSLVVWHDANSNLGTAPSVYARRFDLAAATFTDALPGITVSALASTERFPTATRIGSKFVVAWEDNRQGTYHVFAARIDVATGAVNDAAGIAVTTRAVGQADVSAASDGQTAVLAFRDDGAAATADVDIVRVDETGVVLDPTPVAVAATNTVEGDPAIASNPYGHMLVAYTRYVPAAPYGSARVRARTVFYPRPPALSCGEDDDCQSGFCEDGVCCAADCGSSDPTDCRACSTAAGAGVNGVCDVVVNMATVCRPAVGGCDTAEMCDGVALTCPPNVGAPCDAGVPDAAMPDAPPDAAIDAPMPDARADAAIDAAIPDAAVDAASPDAPTDAAVDAASPDAPTDDAAVAVEDAATIDAPAEGTPDASEPAPGGGGGCGCAIGVDDPASPGAVLLWGLVAIRLRRRRARRA